MNRRARVILSGLVLASIAGCTSLPAPEGAGVPGTGHTALPPALDVTPPATGDVTAPATERADLYWLPPGLAPPSSDAVSLLHYFDYLHSLPASRQREEKARQRKAWKSDKSDFHRIQYAVALTGPAASTSDRRLASRLLQPIAREAKGHDPELHLLAEVLFRDEEDERKLGAMKDIERKLEAMKDMERKLQEMKDLERKLDAMKEIERGLLQRDRDQIPGGTQ